MRGAHAAQAVPKLKVGEAAEGEAPDKTDLRKLSVTKLRMLLQKAGASEDDFKGAPPLCSLSLHLWQVLFCSFCCMSSALRLQCKGPGLSAPMGSALPCCLLGTLPAWIPPTADIKTTARHHEKGAG